MSNKSGTRFEPYQPPRAGAMDHSFEVLSRWNTVHVLCSDKAKVDYKRLERTGFDTYDESDQLGEAVQLT